MSDKKIVLIPTDFSEVCDNAVHHGVELAKNLGHDVALLHVIDKNTKSYLKRQGLGYSYIQDKLEEQAEPLGNEHHVNISCHAEEGNIFDSIEKVAEKLKAELMMLGTHGKVGIQHVTGSYAYRVVTSSPCPTIVVQNKTYGKGYKKIVFPIYETDYVRQKVQWALKIAKTFNAQICFYVLDIQIEEIRNGIEVVLQQIASIFDEYKLQHCVKYSDGTTGFNNQVIQYAADQKADLILIMSKPSVFEYHISAPEERLFFNDWEIPIMCVNPVELNDYRISL